MKTSYLYIIECQDGRYYIGKTDNPRRRFKEHKSGRGARFIKQNGFGRCLMLISSTPKNVSKWEHEFKKKSRASKKLLISMYQQTTNSLIASLNLSSYT